MSNNIYGCPPIDPKICALIGYVIAPVAGSIDGKCDTCGTAIAIGPRVQASHKEHGGELLCYICLMRHPDFVSADQVQSLGPGGHDIERVK